MYACYWELENSGLTINTMLSIIIKAKLNKTQPRGNCNQHLENGHLQMRHFETTHYMTQQVEVEIIPKPTEKKISQQLLLQF